MDLVTGLLAGLMAPDVALAFEEPKALVEAIYAPYRSGGQHGDLDQFYSARLLQLFAAHAEKLAAQAEATAAEPVTVEPVVDFNPFIDGDNALLLDVAIGEPVVAGEQALVTVGFHNFDQPTLLSLSLVREAEGWKVDDVSSMGGEENWMLSWLLLYDPWGM